MLEMKIKDNKKINPSKSIKNALPRYFNTFIKIVKWAKTLSFIYKIEHMNEMLKFDK